MNNKLHSAEMLGILMVVITTQQLSNSDQHIYFAGDALWVSALLAGLIGILVCFAVMKLAGNTGYFDACASIPGARVICGIVLSLLFMEFAAQIYKTAIDMLNLYALSFTPRFFLAFVVLLAVLPGCFIGTAAVGRTMQLILPFMITLLLIVLIFSSIEQWDFNNLFPIFGNGPNTILTNASRSIPSFLWLLLPLIELPQLRKPGAIGMKAVASALFLVAISYFTVNLITPQRALMETSFPIQQLSVMSGYSSFLQRLRSVFLFVWVPAFVGAAAIGLCYATKSLGTAFKMEEPRPLLLPLATMLLCMGAPRASSMPGWYSFVMENKPILHGALLLFLLLPYVVSRLKERKKGGAQGA
ncbi:MAG: GerAB/ArcD/ProY family transporter [Christensenellaceae bacterium]|jgi:hypothetical protein|nr:GerAB/ArcD/ProY family transporter [Christensenellaceae bacterium]